MKQKTIFSLIILTVILSFGVSQSFGQESLIFVQTDDRNYVRGDIITISGSIKTLEDYTQSVTIITTNPNGNFATITQVIPSSDGSFSTSILAGNTMTMNGQYEVHAQYGFQKTTSTFIFTAAGSEPVVAEPRSQVDNRNLKNQIIFLENKIDKANDDNIKFEIENKQLKNKINNLQEKLYELQNIINEQIKMIVEVIQEMKNK